MIAWTLFDVYVVPTLAKRLISTDALTQLGHSVTFSRLHITFRLHEINPETDAVHHLLVKIPNEFYMATVNQELHWTNEQLSSATADNISSIFVAPIITPIPLSVPSTHIVSNNTELIVPPHDPVAPPNITRTANRHNLVRKRDVYSQLLHHRLGHRSIDSIKLADKDDI